MEASAEDRLTARVGKAVLWLLRKVVEQMLPVILPTAIVWGVSVWGAVRVWTHQKSVPLWVFILVLVPASFGAVAFVRIYLIRRPDFHVTVDPINSFCGEANWGHVPAVQVRLAATFANGSQYDVLLMYAYVKGTEPLMHFEEPVHVPPKTATQQDVLFFCTRPKGTIATSYKVTLVFVDAGGRKWPQRVTITGISSPAPSATDAKPPRGSS